MKELHEKNGLKFSGFLTLDLSILTLGYLAAFQLLNRDFYLAAGALAVLLGGRWHGLGILMHDCVHLTAFNNKKLNNLVGEILAPLVLIDYKIYQISHFRHHSNLSEASDPDNQKYMYYLNKFNLNRRLNLVLFIVFYPIVYICFAPKTEFKATFHPKGRSRIRKLALYLLAVQIVLFFSLSRFEHMIAFHLATGYVSLVIKNIREIFEHHLIQNVSTRSFFNTDFILRHTIYAHNIGFHELHHKYPGIPFYRLEEAEKLVSSKTAEDIRSSFDLVKILMRYPFKS